MRKYTLLISLNLILLIILYNLANVFFFQKIIIKKKDEIELINSIDKYLKFTHHVREFKFITNKNQSIEKLFYSKRITNENNKLIIFQGDSWAEQNVLYNKSNMFLNNFVSKFSLNFIDAGVTSYSFSPMNLQLNYLKKDLNYSPDIVVALIDHTDIADEYCRYKDKLILKNNKLKKILLEKDNSGEIYNYKLEYQKKIENIINSDNFNIIKLIKIFFIKKKTNKNENKQICDVKKISNLNNKNISMDKLNYLQKVANLYIDEVFENKKNINLFFVIHPWLIHDNKENFYWSNFFHKIIENRGEKENITLIDFQKLYPNIYLTENLEPEDIYVKNDPTYHLSEKAHLIFIKKVMEEVVKKIHN